MEEGRDIPDVVQSLVDCGSGFWHVIVSFASSSHINRESLPLQKRPTSSTSIDDVLRGAEALQPPSNEDVKTNNWPLREQLWPGDNL